MERASSLDLFEAQHLPNAAATSSTEPAHPGPGPVAAPLWSTSPLPAQFGAGFPTFPAPTFWQPPYLHAGYYSGQAVAPSGIANGWPISDLAAPDPETAAFANSCIQLSQDVAPGQEGEVSAAGADDATVSSAPPAAAVQATPTLTKSVMEAKAAPGPGAIPNLNGLPKVLMAPAETGTPSPTLPRSNGAVASQPAATPGRQQGLSSLSELLAPQNIRYSPSLGAWKVNAAGQGADADLMPPAGVGGQAEPVAAQEAEPQAASEPQHQKMAVLKQARPVEQPELPEGEQLLADPRQLEVKAEVSIEMPEPAGDAAAEAPVAPKDEQDQEEAPGPRHPKPPPVPEPQQRLHGKAELLRAAKRGAPLADDEPGEGRKRTRLAKPTAEPPRSIARVTRAAAGGQGQSQTPAVATRSRRAKEATPLVMEHGRAATRSGRVYKTVQEEGVTSEEDAAESESEAEEEEEEPASSEHDGPALGMPPLRSKAGAAEPSGPVASRSSTRKKHGRLSGSYRELNEGEQSAQSEAEQPNANEPEPEDQPGRNRARRRTLRRQAADLRVQCRRKEEAADAGGSSEGEASDDEVPRGKGQSGRQAQQGRRLAAKRRAPAESDESAESMEGGGEGKGASAAAKNLPTFKDVVLAGLIPQGHVQLFVGAQRKQCHVIIGPTGELTHDKKLYRSLSAFAVSLLRERNPARQSADGWREVFFNGKPIYALREVLLKP